ncbi:zinc dependent phospholipase C family protein [Paenibacillus sp. ACRRX]|uniref:zinc dependent phospholipase C family protein n=1 Tax=Paenibacillus sp. ACRRX TaxID=2918206 RepID=UPI001EF63193|nr:zinc dependent phospholipase C family protein [Paenibacillus sp. ACRRX]MCG7410033.1 zinc dependent phospholipase C family protein [Paenibacillus sp. ACRRX]
MPNIWTHLIFGQEAMRAAGLDTWLQSPSDLRLFNMGCQGPDFLFYHHFLPWQTDKTMNLVGSLMHNEHCGPVLLDFITETDPKDRQRSIYMLGFMLHHVLDRNMHPYVFSRSGSRKWDHQRFEVLMDTHVVKRKLGLETWNTPVWKEIDTGGSFPEAVVDAFERMTERHYAAYRGLVRREAWNEANHAMIGAQKLFHDPRGWKRVITFGQTEPLVYKRRVAHYDVMNEANRPWLDPTGSGETYTTSIWDMWETAASDASSAIAAALAYWKDSFKPEEGTIADAVPSNALANLIKAIGNRSYETGLSLEQNRPIVAEDPIWER